MSTERETVVDDADGEDDAVTPTINLVPENGMPLAEGGILPVGGALGTSPAGGADGMGLGAGAMPVGVPLATAESYGVVAPLGSGATGDESVANRAETAIVEDGRLGLTVAENIHVSVRDGIVLLTGRVPSAAEREIAGQICARVAGASGVENRLTVGV